VTRNRRQALERCLELLQGAVSVIVVNNGSDDANGLEGRFPGIRLIDLPRNFGLTKALNIGIRAADAEYVLLLSPEVRLRGADAVRLADILESQPEIGGVAPRLEGFAQVSELPTPQNPNPSPRMASPGEFAACVSGQAIMVRSFFLRALRHIDERYGDFGSALELSQQIRRAGKKILIHPEVSATLGLAPEQLTGEEKSDREVGTARFLGKHHGFASMLGYLLPRTIGSFLTLRFARGVRLASLKKVDGT